MEEHQKKLRVLSAVAAELNRGGITWAVGASLLLYFKGITDCFHDIDLMVAEKDVQSVKKVMEKFALPQPPNPSLLYKTHCFLEYVVDGVEIDIIAGFVIVRQGNEYYFPLNKERICEYISLAGEEIPLQAVADWRRYYELMGRAEKVKMIDNWNMQRP